MTDLLDRLKAALADRYAIERELGRGGMATVYLAEDLKHRRQVAIKVLLPELASAVGPERFLREIEIAAKLNHPHITPLLDSGEADGFLFYAMPYVEGESLRERLGREKQLSLQDALQIAREIASALGYAHGEGVLHRDIKPGNILLQAGHAMVADFGIARAIDVAGGGRGRLTQTGVAVGTPGYMSPEQASGEREIDARSDIYSLACVLYEMLVGETPFTGPTPRAIVARQLMDPVPSLSTVRSVPDAVETAVNRALEKVPADRFVSAEEFVEALDEAKGAAPRRKAIRPRARQPAVWLLGLVALAIAGGSAGWLVLSSDESGADPAVPSIAVLPLANLTGDPGQESFVNGLTDVVISQLSEISWLDVKSYSSVMRYRDDRPPITEIGRQLGAAYLIEGTVARAEDEIRVSVQLIEAKEDRHVWAEAYRRPLADALKAQEEVARAIASQVQIRLDPETRRVAAEAEAEGVDPEAVDAYIKGRLYHGLDITGQGGPEAPQTAMSYLRQAIALEPDWAPPYGEMADTCKASCPDDSTRVYALAALELDPDQRLAHAALGVVAMRALDWAGADSAFQRSLELDPNADLEGYGVYLWAAGRYAQAAALFRRDLERQPFAAFLSVFLANMYVCGGEHERAIQYLEEYLELSPPDATWDVAAYEALGGAYLRRGDYEQALAEVEGAVSTNPGSTQARSYLGYVNAKIGRTQRAREILEELEQEEAEDLHGLTALYAALGQPEAALRLLERAYEEGSRHVGYLRCTYWIGLDLTTEPALRDNPQFQDLLARISFPE